MKPFFLAIVWFLLCKKKKNHHNNNNKMKVKETLCFQDFVMNVQQKISLSFTLLNAA